MGGLQAGCRASDRGRGEGGPQSVCRVAQCGVGRGRLPARIEVTAAPHRYEMHVGVRDAEALDRDARTRRASGPRDWPGESAHEGEQPLVRAGVEVVHRRRVGARNHHHVAGRDGTAVEEGDVLGVGPDDVRGGVTGGDVAEDAGRVVHDIRCNAE